MRAHVALAAATALLGVAAAAGCGVGPGATEQGEASLRVTRDFGAEPIAAATLSDPTESDTVVRFLDEHADIETSYGGNFVDSIDGLAGGGEEDWFFFVNGYYSEIGAGEARVRAGDRIWWDYRRWQEADRVPAVVGSFPEPFLHGESGAAAPPAVEVECVGAARAACDTAAGALDDAGVGYERERLTEPRPAADALRVLVGAWADLRSDPAAAQLERGPGTSGVYATVGRCDGGYELAVLGSDGKPRLRLTDAGLVAAVRVGAEPPTWVVAGTDAAAAERAAALLGPEALRDRYAVATGPAGAPLPVPAPAGLAATPERDRCR